MTPTKRFTVKLSLVLCTIVFAFGHAHAGSLDPLDNNEIEKAKQIQLSYIKANHPDLLAETNSDTDTSLAESIEILLIERHSFKKGEETGTQRLADLFSYNYNNNTLNQLLINLDTGSVVLAKQDVKVQLPLTKNETQKAIDILLADQEQYQLILKEFEKITGERYTNVNQIEIKAFSFLGDSLLGVSNEGALKCGKHRCAQLLLFTPDRVAFEASPVVDLSIKKIVQNIDF